MPAELKVIHENAGRRVVRVKLSTPKMGGKCFLLDSKGIFILEDCPGVLRTIACTHAGAGNIEAIDGIPDDQGFFPDENMQQPKPIDFKTPDDFEIANAKYWTRNGRPLYRGNPVVMGSWFLDGGFNHGLVIRADGGHQAANAIASIVFMPYKARPPANAD